MVNVIPTQGTPTLLAVTETHLYYRADGSGLRARLLRVPVAGGAEEVLVDGPEGQTLGRVLVDEPGGSIYLVVENVAAKAGSLMRVALSASAPLAPTPVDPSAPEPPIANIGDLVLIGPDLFYSVSFMLKGGAVSTGGLYKVPAAGGSPLRVLNATEGRGLRARGGHLYFSGLEIEGTGTPAALIRMPTDGAGPMEVLLGAGPLEVPSQFELTDTELMWMAGGLMSLPVGGGTPRVLFALPESADPIVIENPTFGLDTDAAYLGWQFLAVSAPAPAVGTQMVRVSLRPPAGGVSSKSIFEAGDSFDAGRIAVAGDRVVFSFPAKPGLAMLGRCGCIAH